MDTAVLDIARALVYLTLLPAAGLPLYHLTAGPVAPLSRGGRRAVSILALLAALASAFWLVASVSAMAALPLAGLDRETLVLVAQATPLGLALVVRLAALALLVLTAWSPRMPLTLAAVAGLVALATLAFIGHAGATEGIAGWIHHLSDMIHLVAAACWLGALVRFVTGIWRGEPAEAAARRLAQFAAAGTAIVAILVVTGVANTILIAGLALPPRSVWTGLLALKLALFAAMLGLAALNRWRLTPALDRGEIGAAGRLRRSLSAELACAVGLVGVVAVLGTLDPAGG